MPESKPRKRRRQVGVVIPEKDFPLFERLESRENTGRVVTLERGKIAALLIEWALPQWDDAGSLEKLFERSRQGLYRVNAHAADRTSHDNYPEDTLKTVDGSDKSGNRAVTNQGDGGQRAIRRIHPEQESLDPEPEGSSTIKRKK